LSNHVDVVEASTIARRADVSPWNENDDSNANLLHERFWRQTLDMNRSVRNGRHGLSILRRYCICGGYDDPAMDMFQCLKVGCGLWNHEFCLIKKWEAKAWEEFQKGTLSHKVPESASSAHQIRTIQDAFTNGDETEGGADPKTKRKREKRNQAISGPWKGKLVAKIASVEGAGGNDSHFAAVVQLVPSPRSENGSGFEPKVWLVKMSCLQCGHEL